MGALKKLAGAKSGGAYACATERKAAAPTFGAGGLEGARHRYRLVGRVVA